MIMSNNNRVFCRTRFVLLAASFVLVSCLAYFSTLKMGAIYFSETSFDFHRTAQFYIPEDGTFHPQYMFFPYRENPNFASI
jgi:hypothetical protein